MYIYKNDGEEREKIYAEKTRKVIFEIILIIVIVLAAAACAGAGLEKKKVTTLELPVIGDAGHLQELLREWEHRPILPGQHSGMMMEDTVAAEPETPAASVHSQPAFEQVDNAGDFSETNVQVQGVDEADLIKTDGRYIYKVDKDSLQIIQAVPADNMQCASEIYFDEQTLAPQQIYIDKNRLVLLGEYWKPREDNSLPWYESYQNCFGLSIQIYDISKKEQPRLMRQEDIPGSCISTRKVGDYLYFAANQNISLEALQEKKVICQLIRSLFLAL